MNEPSKTMHKLFSGLRTTRIGDQDFSRVDIDSDTAQALASSSIGIFIHGFLKLETMLGRLLRALDTEVPSTSVIVYASKEAGQYVRKLLEADGLVLEKTKHRDGWRVGNRLFSSIEALAKTDLDEEEISAVYLLDPTCMVYRARSIMTYSGKSHDRPQLVANFLHDHRNSDGSQPLFALLTCQKAATQPTAGIARAFCLEAFWFMDGLSIR